METRGVLKRSSDHTAIIVVQTGSGQSEKRNTPHAQQLGNCTQRLGHSVADIESSLGSPFPIGPGSSLVHATRQRVRSRTTKPGNVNGGRSHKSVGNSAVEIHSKNLCLSNCSPRDVFIIWKFCGGSPQQESPLNKSCGGNPQQESLPVVIIWKFCGGNPQQESESLNLL